MRNAILRHESRRSSLIVFVMIGLTVAGGWIGGMISRLAIGDREGVVLGIALGFITGFSLSIAAVVWLDDVLTARLVDKFKSLRRCPSCGYDLTGLVSDATVANGCTICPECGAAWRLKREEDSSLGGVLERLP